MLLLTLVQVQKLFCTLPAAKAIVEDGSNNVTFGNNITVGGTVDGVDIASRDTVLTNTTTTAKRSFTKSWRYNDWEHYF